MQIDARGALAALDSALGTLLSGVAIERRLLLPTRVGPAGIGGFVGLSRTPRGEIAGVRVDADLRVVVRAAESGALDTAAQAVTTRLASAGREALVAAGIQKLCFSSLSELASPGPGVLEREVCFTLSYEFQALPAADEGIIEQIPIQLATAEPAPAEPPGAE